MYRFALRPRWILSHLLVAAIVVGCVWAGFWQLRRLDDKRDALERYERRGTEEVVDVGALLAPDSTAEAVEAVALRRVTATGRYLAEDQVTVRNRSFEGAPGHWVITPLLLDDGSAVLVNRGWVPLAVVEDMGRVAPPDGEVAVDGLITESQVRGRLGAVDQGGSDVVDFARVDVELIGDRLDGPVLPAYVTLTGQEPPGGELPAPVAVVEPDEGPHFGYAVQWFIFASIAVIGYPLVLRRIAGDRATEEGPAAGPARRRSRHVPVDDDEPVGR